LRLSFDHIDNISPRNFSIGKEKLSLYHAMYGCFVDSIIVKNNRLPKIID
jgi:hypothetical protein